MFHLKLETVIGMDYICFQNLKFTNKLRLYNAPPYPEVIFEWKKKKPPNKKGTLRQVPNSIKLLM